MSWQADVARVELAQEALRKAVSEAGDALRTELFQRDARIAELEAKLAASVPKRREDIVLEAHLYPAPNTDFVYASQALVRAAQALQDKGIKALEAGQGVKLWLHAAKSEPIVLQGDTFAFYRRGAIILATPSGFSPEIGVADGTSIRITAGDDEAATDGTGRLVLQMVRVRGAVIVESWGPYSVVFEGSL